MGNNNSATASAQLGPQSQQWMPRSHSLDGGDDPRNRMRKGYAAKQYMGHRAPPQKVLPTLNPTKAAKKLKPTSNGRNLKQCGTISGRKLNDPDGDISVSGNLITEEMSRLRLGPTQYRISKQKISPGFQNGHSSPNLLENGAAMEGKSESPLILTRNQNFHESEPELRSRITQTPISHIQESPAKKQIRTKKKKSAPPPPEIKRYSKSPPPAMHHTPIHHRIFKTKADRKLSGSSIEGRQISGARSSPQSLTTSSSLSITPKEGDLGKKSAQSPSPSSSKSISDITPNIIRMRNNEKNKRSKSGSVSPAQNGAHNGAQKHYLPYSSPISKEKGRQNLRQASSPQVRKTSRRAPTSPQPGQNSRRATSPPPGQNSRLRASPERKPSESQLEETKKLVAEKKRFYFGMDLVDFGSKSTRPTLTEFEKRNIPPPPKSRDPKSESEIPAFSFYKSAKDESLSDNMSSSSEMDIVLRPTLPPKPQQLPKFSPSAAWNRIDLDSPNSSEEEALRFNLRKNPNGSVLAPGTKERLGEGDSGISGLDGDGGGSPEILPPPLPITATLKGGPCWTPEQDLDDSSSEFEAEEDDLDQEQGQGQSSYSSERPRLTTRSNFFSSKSDSEGVKGEPVYARSTKAKGGAMSGGKVDEVGNPSPHGGSATSHDPSTHSTSLEFKPSLNRIINYRRTLRRDKEVGLDTNWFLSRSEPNSLNMTHLMVGDEAGRGRGRGDEEEEGIRSENGYAPTNLNFEEITAGTSAPEWNKSASLISLSHFVYLPQQRSTYDDTSSKRNRRTKSVENLLKQNGGSSSDGFRKNQTENQTVAQQQHNHQQSNNNYNKRRKFKFQSTLKVMERKRIEKELSREAEEKEIERLKEIEAMKRVEEEFQKKRKNREKQILEEQSAIIQNVTPFKGNLPNGNVSMVTSISPWEDSGQRPRVLGQQGQSSIRTITPCQSSDNSSTKSTPNVTKINLSQRQDPEGAPSAQDLRKELILGAKKRNGVSSASSDLTQELSEYRQERRQYCDYRSSPRLSTEVSNNSRSRNKFVDSTSSDIYPLTGRVPLLEKQRQRPKSTVIYPEIVCDIPNKPFPYTVNFSRLSGSHTSLLIEDRPTSGTGFGSGPSSVISDNYRRDWAHQHGSKNSGSSIAIGGKSSSITSLHSTSDNARIHQADLTDGTVNSPRIVHRVIGRSSHRVSQVKENTGPTTVTITMNNSQPSSLKESSNEKDSGISKLKSEACLQPQSFVSYKTKSYRPVIFNPTNCRPH